MVAGILAASCDPASVVTEGNTDAPVQLEEPAEESTEEPAEESAEAPEVTGFDFDPPEGWEESPATEGDQTLAVYTDMETAHSLKAGRHVNGSRAGLSADQYREALERDLSPATNIQNLEFHPAQDMDGLSATIVSFERGDHVAERWAGVVIGDTEWLLEVVTGDFETSERIMNEVLPTWTWQ